MSRGRAGGLAVVAKYGPEHMGAISKGARKRPRFKSSEVAKEVESADEQRHNSLALTSWRDEPALLAALARLAETPISPKGDSLSMPYSLAGPGTRTLMRCGHVAEERRAETGTPYCPLCIRLTVLAVRADEPPDLEGRQADCYFCDQTVPSALTLRFFEFRKDRPSDGYFCGCWDREQERA